MAFLHANLAKFDTTAAEMDARLRARLSLGELFALTLALCSVGIFLWVHGQLHIQPFDYNVYVKTGYCPSSSLMR